MTLDTAPRERFVEANGLRHHVLEWGAPDSADVFVLCHGFLDLAWGFATLAPRLARAGYRVLACDFRGHGESGWVPPGGYYYFPDYVLDLHALLPQLVRAPFHLLGHSMGGTVSTLFAATHAASVRTLVLMEGLGPSGDAPERAPHRMKSWLESVPSARREPVQLRDLDEAYARLRARHRSVGEPLLRLLAERSTSAHPSGRGLTWRFDPLHRTRSPIPFDPTRFMHFVSDIEAPTLLVYGEHGFKTADDDARRERLRSAQCVEIRGAGHMLHWTHDEEIAAHVLAHAGRSASTAQGARS